MNGALFVITSGLASKGTISEIKSLNKQNKMVQNVIVFCQNKE